MEQEYIVIAFTENQIGVLNRITGLYLRRKINIESLKVSESSIKGISMFVISAFTTHEIIERLVKQLRNMMELARVITIGALNRNESRGSHYKPEFPNRNDEEFLKTTKAKWTPDGPAFEWEDVDISHFKPVARVYDKDKGGK